MSKRIYVIINPSSGTGDPANVVPGIEAQLKQRSLEYTIKIAQTPSQAKAAASKVALAKYDAIAVYGGDGTVIAIFKAVYQAKIPVLILPGGSANVLAKALNLPPDVGKCLDLFVEDLYLLRRFGVALANDEPFILDLHFGVWAESIQSTSSRLKQAFGQLAYGLAAIKQLGSAAKYAYQLQLDGKKLKVDAYACIVANEGFHNILGVPLFPYPHTPGFLQVAAVKRVNQFVFLRWFILRCLGRQDSGVVEAWRVKEAVIEDAPQQMLFDDEALNAKLPFTIQASNYTIAAIAAPLTASSFWRRLRLQAAVEPYRIYDHLRRVVTGGPALKSTQIALNLYVGGQYRPWAVGRLRKWGITGVVNMRNLRHPSYSRGLEVLNLPTRDHHPPSLEALHKGVVFIQQHIQNGGAVYVHCQLGEGRGPIMAAAYLVSQGMRPRDAVAHIERFRRLVRPNAKQLHQLARFEEELKEMP